jgi:hypothetical protein
MFEIKFIKEYEEDGITKSYVLTTIPVADWLNWKWIYMRGIESLFSGKLI